MSLASGRCSKWSEVTSIVRATSQWACCCFLTAIIQFTVCVCACILLLAVSRQDTSSNGLHVTLQMISVHTHRHVVCGHLYSTQCAGELAVRLEALNTTSLYHCEFGGPLKLLSLVVCYVYTQYTHMQYIYVRICTHTNLLQFPQYNWSKVFSVMYPRLCSRQKIS